MSWMSMQASFPIVRAFCLAAALALSACGGGGGGGGGGGSSGGSPSPTPPTPMSASEAARFLTQATFGPTDADIDALRATTFEAWINDQLSMPPPAESHLEYLDAALARSAAPGGIGPNQFYSSWWRQALTE